jgi:hypothetical protein
VLSFDHRPGNRKLIFTTETQRTQRGIAATKSEALNPKSETNPNDQNSNDPNKLNGKMKKNGDPAFWP